MKSGIVAPSQVGTRIEGGRIISRRSPGRRFIVDYGCQLFSLSLKHSVIKSQNVSSKILAPRRNPAYVSDRAHLALESSLPFWLTLYWNDYGRPLPHCYQQNNGILMAIYRHSQPRKVGD